MLLIFSQLLITLLLFYVSSILIFINLHSNDLFPFCSTRIARKISSNTYPSRLNNNDNNNKSFLFITHLQCFLFFFFLSRWWRQTTPLLPTDYLYYLFYSGAYNIMSDTSSSSSSLSEVSIFMIFTNIRV